MATGLSDYSAPVKPKQRARRDDQESFDIYKEFSLSRINGEINKMKKSDMIQLLKQNGLHTRGVKEVLSKRLKHYYKKERMNIRYDSEEENQYYKYFLVIDFEATCEKTKDPDYIYEIIEFPAVLVNSKTCAIEDEFHSYCRPTLNPTLSKFCISLTGITQAQVDAAPVFSDVFKDFEKWMLDRNLLQNRTTMALVSDGPWDFSRFFNVQCCLTDIKYPRWARKWINIKKIYGNFYKINKPKIQEMLSNLGMQFQGRLHCGLDDARNLARIIQRLVEDGCVLKVNEKLSAGKLEAISEDERKHLYTVQSKPETGKGESSTNKETSQAACLSKDSSSVDEDLISSLNLPGNKELEKTDICDHIKHLAI